MPLEEQLSDVALGPVLQAAHEQLPELSRLSNLDGLLSLMVVSVSPSQSGISIKYSASLTSETYATLGEHLRKAGIPLGRNTRIRKRHANQLNESKELILQFPEHNADVFVDFQPPGYQNVEVANAHTKCREAFDRYSRQGSADQSLYVKTAVVLRRLPELVIHANGIYFPEQNRSPTSTKLPEDQIIAVYDSLRQMFNDTYSRMRESFRKQLLKPITVNDIDYLLTQTITETLSKLRSTRLYMPRDRVTALLSSS